MRVTLNRPEVRNALTFETYRQLCDFFHAERFQKKTRVVIITGKGKGFCSGGDVHGIIGALRGAKMREVLEFAWMTGELVRHRTDAGGRSMTSGIAEPAARR